MDKFLELIVDANMKQDKNWPNLKLPLNLSEALQLQTKNTLDGIRKHLGIGGLSNVNKPLLIEGLEPAIPSALKKVFHLFDQQRFDLLKLLMNRNNGSIPVNKLGKNRILIPFLRDRGIAFTGSVQGEMVLVIPQEIREAFQLMITTSYKEVVRKNTEWLLLTRGLLFYNGTLTLNRLIEQIEVLTGEKIRFVDYLNFLLDQASYAGFESDEVGFSNFNVEEPERVKQEHDMRPNVPFYNFTKKQLLEAGKAGFIDRNPSFNALQSYLIREYAMDREEAEMIAESCVYSFQNGESMGSILQELGEDIEIDSLETMDMLAGLLAQLNNHTRLWFLKGHIPGELSAYRERKEPMGSMKGPVSNVIDLNAVRKAGRNEPCICGSGKKYKKCCGK
ncbi:MAG: SEC-C metal-binding domain-containing protein [Candidatus Pristimantibacillus sp.]